MFHVEQFIMNIGEIIRKIREARGWKQETIAAELNTSQQNISSLEKQALPNMKTILQFCAAVNIQPVYLISDIEISEESLEKYGHVSYHKLTVELNYLHLKETM